MWDVPLSNPHKAEGDTSAARGTADARGDKHPLPDRHRDLPVLSLPDVGPKSKTTGVAQRGVAASPARLPAPLRRSPACTPSRRGERQMLQTEQSHRTQSSFPRPLLSTLTWDSPGPQQLPSLA